MMMDATKGLPLPATPNATTKSPSGRELKTCRVQRAFVLELIIMYKCWTRAYQHMSQVSRDLADYEQVRLVRVCNLA